MRDVDALRARLAIALLLGASACSDEATNKDGISVDFSKIKGGRSERDEDRGRDDAPDREDGGSDGGGEESTGTVPKPAADPVEFCRSAELTFTKKEADTKRRTGTGELHGCPVSIQSAGSRATLALRDTATQLLRDAGNDEHCCYEEQPVAYGVGGRPLVLGTGGYLPAFEIGGSHPTTTPRRLRAAAGWLHDARAEFASVASFHRAARELAAICAPSDLIDACLAAARDEQRHTRLCLDVARRLAHRRLSLAPLRSFAPRPLDLEGVLRATFLEGCVAETIAGLVVRRAAVSAEDPSIAATLEEIADDEARHAALAWRTLGWGLRRLGAERRAEWIAWAMAQRPATRRPRSSGDPDAAWGRLRRATRDGVTSDAWTHCITPLLEQLAATDDHPTAIAP
jgi:hypothetical protein